MIKYVLSGVFFISWVPIVFADIDMFADLLIWQASQEASSTWATIVQSGTSTGVRTTNLSEANVDFDYETGFRIGGKYISTCNNWDAKFSWTHYRASTDNHIRVNRQILVSEYWSGFLSGNFFFGADLDWKLEMNMLDLNFGHQFKLTPSFQVRPAIGLKGGTINQRSAVIWHAILYDATENVKNHFKGLGPSIALETDWDLCSTKANVFGLFGDFEAALMYGRWNVSDVYLRPSTSLLGPTNITTDFDNRKFGTGMFGFVFGAQWIHASKCVIKLKFGYEMQYWANQLRVPTFQQLPTHGNLTFQGVTCGAALQI